MYNLAIGNLLKIIPGIKMYFRKGRAKLRQLDNETLQRAEASGLFQVMDFYMVRAPLLPVDLFSELFSQDSERGEEARAVALSKMVLLAADPYVREALEVASPSLLTSLPHLTASDHPRKQDQALRGFLRYLLRMTSRPTPFGLFAGVASGSFGAQTNMQLKERSAHRKHARPDMEWLTKLLAEMEGDPDLYRQLHLSWNSLCERNGSRIEIPFTIGRGTEQGQNLALEKPSIRVTPVVELVIDLVQEPIRFQDLIELILEQYAQTPYERIEAYILQLFQQEFLISELRPPLTSVDPFQHVVQVVGKMRGVELWKQRLQRIEQQLAAYNGLPIGEGEALLQAIKEEMQQAIHVKDPVQVDTALMTEPVTLPESVRDEVARAAELLWKLAPTTIGLDNLSSFRSDFLQKYDTYREVPLLTLLSDDRGLGYPAGYLHPAGHRQFTPTVSAHLTKREALLMDWVFKSFADGSGEVELSEPRIAQLIDGEPDGDITPLSFELYFTLAAPSAQAMDEGEFQLVLAPNAGSDNVGKSFGRFLHVLDERVVQQLATAQEAEQMLQPDAAFAELVYFPNVSRHTNVVITTHNRPYEIPLGAIVSKPDVDCIPLSDLVVGCTADSLYLKSISLNKRIIPTANHMLNPLAAPNVYRFLRDLAFEGQRNWSKFSWGSLDQMTRLPRLRYGRVILSPARWKLFPHAEPFGKDMDEPTWRDAFATWRKEWSVPRYVLLTQTDNRLMLDLEHPLHLAELRRDFQKLQADESLLLLETDGSKDNQLLRSPAGNHVVECVFPILRTSPRKPMPVPGMHLPLPEPQRVYLPGSEWLYVKLYGSLTRQEELIGWHLRSWLDWAKQQGLAEESYFIRYRDPEDHLRVRFRGQPEQLSGKLLPELARWGRQLQMEGLLHRFVVDTYDPELERYGGSDVIHLAEALFAADSALVADWICRKRNGEWPLSWEMTGVLSAVDLLRQLGLNQEQQLHFFRTIDHKLHLDEFRKDRKTYLALADFERSELFNNPKYGVMTHHFWQRAPFIRAYVQALQTANIPSHKWEDLVASVLHLHMNRLLGVDRDLEHKIMTLTRHTVQGIYLARRNVIELKQ